MKTILRSFCVLSLVFTGLHPGFVYAEATLDNGVLRDSLPPEGMTEESNVMDKKLERIDSTLAKLKECLNGSNSRKAVTIRKEIQRLKEQKKRLKEHGAENEKDRELGSDRPSRTSARSVVEGLDRGNG